MTPVGADTLAAERRALGLPESDPGSLPLRVLRTVSMVVDLGLNALGALALFALGYGLGAGWL